MNYYSDRIRKFQKSMKSDYVILVSPENVNSNVFYFTGFRGFGVLIISKSKKPTFLTTKLDICNVMNKDMKIVTLDRAAGDILKKLVSKHRSLGFDFSTLSVGSYRRFKKLLKPKKVIDVGDQLLEQRSIKDADEIKQIKKACDVICSVVEDTIKNMSKFTYEYEVKRYIETESRKRGYEMSFETIVASGKNAANPHYTECKDKLHRGFLVIDCGVRVNGYCSDITRTVFLGNPTEKELSIYDHLLRVQLHCIELFRQNKPIKEVDEYTRKQLGKFYIHALGHGIGIDVHELPWVSIRNKDKVKDNEFFTVEPGVYYPNKLGIRIEDDLMKTKGKVQLLTPLTKKLIVINNKIYK